MVGLVELVELVGIFLVVRILLLRFSRRELWRAISRLSGSAGALKI